MAAGFQPGTGQADTAGSHGRDGSQGGNAVIGHYLDLVPGLEPQHILNMMGVHAGNGHDRTKRLGKKKSMHDVLPRILTPPSRRW